LSVGINVGFMRPVLRTDEANILTHELGQEDTVGHANAAASAAAKIAAANEQQEPPFQPVDLEREELLAVRRATERIGAALGLDDAVPGLRELHARSRAELERLDDRHE
jgi:hypothetical protein